MDWNTNSIGADPESSWWLFGCFRKYAGGFRTEESADT
jgi:hypothetical protein